MVITLIMIIDKCDLDTNNDRYGNDYDVANDSNVINFENGDAKYNSSNIENKYTVLITTIIKLQ